MKALLHTSSETQGQIVGAKESLNRRKNMAQKKSKERQEEPLGTMSYQTSSKRSPPFWLLIGARKLVFFWVSEDVLHKVAQFYRRLYDGGHEPTHPPYKSPYLIAQVLLGSDTVATSDSDGRPCVEPMLSSTKARRTLSNLTLFPHQITENCCTKLIQTPLFCRT